MFKQLFKRKRKNPEVPFTPAIGEAWPDYRLPENRDVRLDDEAEALIAADVENHPYEPRIRNV